MTIRKTELLLDLGADFEDLESEYGHSCKKCSYLLNGEQVTDVFHNLSSMEENISREVKMTSVYISGYVARKDSDYDDTFLYLEQYGKYTEVLNRGGLMLPGDNVCQWVIFSYILFHEISDFVCRKSLSNVLVTVSDFYSLSNIEKRHANTLSNILPVIHPQIIKRTKVEGIEAFE